MEANHRFKGFKWYKQLEITNNRVGILGLGGIGSWLTILLARLDVLQIYAYDMDTVEKHNIGCQLGLKDAIGKPKSDSILQLVTKTCERNKGCIYVYNQKYDEESRNFDTIFSCFDNLVSRKVAFNKWVRNPSKEIFIDGRLDGEMLQIFCLTRDKPENYEKYLQTLEDSILIEGANSCTTQQSSHMGAMIASLMVSLYTNYISNIAEGKEVREVPYFTEVFVPLLTFNTK